MAVSKACMLAAGLGDRLGDIADKPPKALLSFGGRSLLSRHLENLSAIGVRHVVIGVGYRADAVIVEAEAAGFPGRLEFVENPDFREGSMITLAALGAAMTSGEDDTLLMDADVLYDPVLLTRLAESRYPNCLLLDRDFEDGDEPVKMCIGADGRIVDFRKIVETPFEWCGESVGFFKLSAAAAADLVSRAKGYVAADQREAPYEEAIRDAILADGDAFGFEDITGIPWIEIDFAEDIRRAQSEILPRIPS